MAGFTKIYCIGSGGGFLGQDGPNQILAQIWLGEGERQWYEARYFDDELGAMGRLRVIVPPAPDGTDNLLDACIAFFPAAFEGCPSYRKVMEQLGAVERLDFHARPGEVPEAWSQLREEARSAYADLALWSAEIQPAERG